MGLITILRGFKVPLAVLDRFLVSNGVEETYGTPPGLYRIPGASTRRPLQPSEAFLRSKLVAAGDADSQARIFIPQREGMAPSTYGYVAYAYVMVLSQRKISLALELPDQAPPGFTELRREILGHTAEGEEKLLQVTGIRDEEGEDPSSMLFVVLTDEREFPLERPFARESDLRCGHCGMGFEDWYELQYHRRDAHEIKLGNLLPDDM